MQDYTPIQITVTGQLDGSSVMAAQTQPIPRSAASGFMEVAVAANIGLIDPMLAGGFARNPLFLRAYQLRLGAAGGANAIFSIVDDNGNVIELVRDLTGVQNDYSDQGWIIPAGARLRLDDDVANAGPHQIRLHFWELDSTYDTSLAVSAL